MFTVVVTIALVILIIFLLREFALLIVDSLKAHREGDDEYAIDAARHAGMALIGLALVAFMLYALTMNPVL